VSTSLFFNLSQLEILIAKFKVALHLGYGFICDGLDAETLLTLGKV
jgi:hypothetical protein